MDHSSNSDTAEPTSKEILEALDKITSSERFQRSERARTMLRYIVNETLAGRGDQLKAYSLAMDAFGRDENFDAETSTLVRVHAGRLRELLDAYYLSEGTSDILEIRMPRGGYIATFLSKDPSDFQSDIVDNTSSTTSFPRRLLLPLTAMALAAIAAVFFIANPFTPPPELAQKKNFSANNVMAQVAFEVTSVGKRGAEFSNFLKVRADSTIAKFGQMYVSKSGPDSLITSGKQPAYLTKILTSDANQATEVNIQILDFATGTIVSSSDISLPFKNNEPDVKSLEAEITKNFSQVGPVFHHLQARNDLSADLKCVLDTMQTLREDEHHEPNIDRLIICLHEALERHPSLGIAGVQLAVLLISEGDRKHLYQGKSAYVEARNVLDKVLKVTPNLPGALMVMAMATFVDGDIETAFEFDRRVAALNPNSPLIRAQQGMHLIRAGRFQKGREIMQKSIDLSKEPRLLHRAYLYFAKVETGTQNDDSNLASILASQTTNFIGIAAYLANIQLGNEDRALRIINELNGGKPADKEFLTKTLLDQRFKPDAAKMIVDRVTKTSIWPSNIN